MSRPFPCKSLFRSYFLIILTYSRLHGANQWLRSVQGMKKRIMLTFLRAGLFSALVALVKQPARCEQKKKKEKKVLHYQFTRLWEAAASHRAQWAPPLSVQMVAVRPLVEITLNKNSLKKSLSGCDKRKVGLPCHLQRLAPLSLLCQLKGWKKNSQAPGLSFA